MNENKFISVEHGDTLVRLKDIKTIELVQDRLLYTNSYLLTTYDNKELWIEEDEESYNIITEYLKQNKLGG